TMTRLEGIFVLFSVIFYLLTHNLLVLNKFNIFKAANLIYSNIRGKFKEMIILLLPQLLIYAPWTIYAKFIYKGEVSNDYFNEFDLFKFNLSRFEYFGMYTLFILVAPLTLYFMFLGIKYFLLGGVSKHKSLISVAVFTILEF